MPTNIYAHYKEFDGVLFVQIESIRDNQLDFGVDGYLGVMN